MNFSTSIFKNTQIYIHIVFGCIIALLSIFNLLNTRSIILWYEISIAAILISAFYLHAFLLMKLISKNRKNEYSIYSILLFLISIVSVIVLTSKATSVYLKFTQNIDIEFLKFGSGDRSIKHWLLRVINNNDEQMFFVLIVFISSFTYGLLYRSKQEYSNILKSIKNIRYLELKINVIIWTLVYIVFWLGCIPKQQLAGTFIFIFSVSLFYIHKLIITPFIFKYKNRILYFSYTLLAFTTSLLLIISTDTYLKFSYHSYNNNNVISMFQLTFNVYATVLLIITSLSFLYGYIESSVKANTINLFRQIGRKDSELKLLKSQVSPHFMFNSLNTLYATALEEKADKTAESITQLADLIRFLQTDIMKETIPLKNEISYINNFTSFQLLRCSAKQDIRINYKNTDNIFVSPGLFIPFVENAFKHGINPSVESELKIEFIYNSGVLTFECTNSICRTQKDKPGMGSGIKNVQKRLDIIYPNNHTFEIKESENRFSVLISIKLRKND